MTDVLEAGSLVWGKVKGLPWWPGQMLPSHLANNEVRKREKPGHYLVAFCGDNKYAWLKPEFIVSFEANEAKYSTLSSMKTWRLGLEECRELRDRRAGLQPATEHFPLDVLNYKSGTSKKPLKSPPSSTVKPRNCAAPAGDVPTKAALTAPPSAQIAKSAPVPAAVPKAGEAIKLEQARPTTATTITRSGQRVEVRRSPRQPTQIVPLGPKPAPPAPKAVSPAGETAPASAAPASAAAFQGQGLPPKRIRPDIPRPQTSNRPPAQRPVAGTAPPASVSGSRICAMAIRHRALSRSQRPQGASAGLSGGAAAASGSVGGRRPADSAVTNAPEPKRPRLLQQGAPHPRGLASDPHRAGAGAAGLSSSGAYGSSGLPPRSSTGPSLPPLRKSGAPGWEERARAPSAVPRLDKGAYQHHRGYAGASGAAVGSGARGVARGGASAAGAAPHHPHLNGNKGYGHGWESSSRRSGGGSGMLGSSPFAETSMYDHSDYAGDDTYHDVLSMTYAPYRTYYGQHSAAAHDSSAAYAYHHQHHTQHPDNAYHAHTQQQAYVAHHHAPILHTYVGGIDGTVMAAGASLAAQCQDRDTLMDVVVTVEIGSAQDSSLHNATGSMDLEEHGRHSAERHLAQHSGDDHAQRVPEGQQGAGVVVRQDSSGAEEMMTVIAPGSGADAGSGSGGFMQDAHAQRTLRAAEPDTEPFLPERCAGAGGDLTDGADHTQAGGQVPRQPQPHQHQQHSHCHSKQGLAGPDATGTDPQYPHDHQGYHHYNGVPAEQHHQHYHPAGHDDAGAPAPYTALLQQEVASLREQLAAARDELAELHHQHLQMQQSMHASRAAAGGANSNATATAGGEGAHPGRRGSGRSRSTAAAPGGAGVQHLSSSGGGASGANGGGSGSDGCGGALLAEAVRGMARRLSDLTVLSPSLTGTAAKQHLMMLSRQLWEVASRTPGADEMLDDCQRLQVARLAAEVVRIATRDDRLLPHANDCWAFVNAVAPAFNGE